MVVEHRVALPLRVFLVLLFGILVVFQTLSLPGQFAYMAQESPDLAYLSWPLTAVSVFWVLCVQVVIVATWKLLTPGQGRPHLQRRPRWRGWTRSSWAIAAAWVVLLGVFLYVGFRADDPGLPLLLFLLSVGGRRARAR